MLCIRRCMLQPRHLIFQLWIIWKFYIWNFSAIQISSIINQAFKYYDKIVLTLLHVLCQDQVLWSNFCESQAQLSIKSIQLWTMSSFCMCLFYFPLKSAHSCSLICTFLFHRFSNLFKGLSVRIRFTMF
jgi:hypothetical protein